MQDPGVLHHAPDGPVGSSSSIHDPHDGGDTDLEFWTGVVAVGEALGQHRAALVAGLRRRGIKPEELFGRIGAGLLTPHTEESNRAVRWASFRSFTTAQIAVLYDLDPDWAAEYLGKWGASQRSKDIVRLFQEGLDPHEITRRLGLSSRGRVYTVLEKSGLTTVKRRPKGHNRKLEQHRERAAELYRQGLTYSAIAEDIGVKQPQVRTLLRGAHRDGLLPEYGERQAARMAEAERPRLETATSPEED